MIIEIGIIGGEVAVEVWIGMIVINIVGGTEIIVAEVEAGVLALTTLEAEAKVDMMMIAGVLVDHLTGQDYTIKLYHYINLVVFMLVLGLLVKIFLHDICSIHSASPPLRSPSPRRSVSPHKISPRGESPDRRSRDERSPTPRSASPLGRRADSRSPPPRNSDFDVS